MLGKAVRDQLKFDQKESDYWRKSYLKANDNMLKLRAALGRLHNRTVEQGCAGDLSEEVLKLLEATEPTHPVGQCVTRHDDR